MNVKTAESTLTSQIVDAAYEVHTLLGGPGLLETVYESALSHELFLRGMHNQRQRPVAVRYKNTEVREPLFIDLIVENQVIVEVKATPQDYSFYHAQILTYLRLTNTKYGLLINFGKKDLKAGLIYVTNTAVS